MMRSHPYCVQVTGGRNGYGAKLANIFSTEFVIETCDGKRQRQYKQVGSRFGRTAQGCRRTVAMQTLASCTMRIVEEL